MILRTIDKKISSSLYAVAVWVESQLFLKDLFLLLLYLLTYKHSLLLMLHYKSFALGEPSTLREYDVP